jgi:hypothetical protein
LGGELADAVLDLLQALADDADDVDGNLRMAVHKLQ